MTIPKITPPKGFTGLKLFYRHGEFKGWRAEKDGICWYIPVDAVGDGNWDTTSPRNWMTHPVWLSWLGITERSTDGCEVREVTE